MARSKMTHKKRRSYAKARYKVINWKEYNEALRRRGDLRIWISEAAIEHWHPKRLNNHKGRPQLYSDYAIECCLLLRQVYRLPLRQTEGFVH